MSKVTVSIVGAGNRGYEAYGNILSQREDAEIVAVAEPDEEKRIRFAKAYGIEREMCFTDWKELLAKDRLSDGIIIATPDRLHIEPLIEFAKKGYRILLEKPIAQSADDVLKILDCKETSGRVIVAHVLRYTPFYKTVKTFIDEGKIGKLIGLEQTEKIGFFHFAHSYVRGNWRNEKESGPTILTKSCHDADILHWLTGRACKKVISRGKLYYFNEQNKPQGASNRCLDCPVEKFCPYSAVKIYLQDNTDWPVSVISTDRSLEARKKAIKYGPYGRCVYSSDNDVVDHQTVFFVFDNDVIASFTMSAFTGKITRTLDIHGSHGEIVGDLESGNIELNIFGKGKKNYVVKRISGGHSGGDYGLIEEFVAWLRDEKNFASTTLENSIHSHMMAFAAEHSRRLGGAAVSPGYFANLKKSDLY